MCACDREVPCGGFPDNRGQRSCCASSPPFGSPLQFQSGSLPPLHQLVRQTPGDVNGQGGAGFLVGHDPLSGAGWVGKTRSPSECGPVSVGVSPTPHRLSIIDYN